MRSRLREDRLRGAAALQWLADCILAYTDASGVAIALEDGTAMVCCASSGIAPALSVRIDPDAGLSGECLRTGKVVRCDDTAKDVRVDPEVCRTLNLRSVLVVPLYREGKLGGILEWFSSRAEPFDEETLRDLYGFAQLAREVAGFQPIADADPARPQNETTGNADSKPGSSERKIKRLAVWAAPALVAAVAFTLWMGRNSPAPPEAVQTQAAVAPLQAVPEESRPAEKTEGSDRVTRAALREAVPPPARRSERERTVSTQAPSDSVTWRNSKAIPALRLPESVAPAPLQVSSAQLPAMPQAPTPTPALVLQPYAQVSTEEVTGGRVLVRVDPVYPAVARQFRRQGEVVVAGVVNREGVLQNLRALSGDPMLTPAALAAASRWRYEPYRVGNNAIEKEITITFRFKL